MLQKHFGGIVKMVKDLKITVESIEKKISLKENEEIREILETQRVIDEVIVANSDAIKRIDKEIEKLSKKETKERKVTGEETCNTTVGVVKPKTKQTAEKVNDVAVNNESNDALEKENVDVVSKSKRKKCRYFDRGYCKFTNKCRYSHTEDICNSYRNNQKCAGRDCPYRHPKVCKWVTSSRGCVRENCVYLHTGFTEEKENVNILCEYKCEGCKSAWKDGKHVIEHIIHNRKTFFCLNCEDWIKYKENVFNAGWSLLDEDGYLRKDI